MNATSLSTKPEDLELSPFNQRGGLGNPSFNPFEFDGIEIQTIPKGLRPPAQGCEARATLGHGDETSINPNGVVPILTVGKPQPHWGWHPPGRFSQGSSCLATLGYGPESLWDSPSAQIRNYQCGGLGKAHQLFGSELRNLLNELNSVLAV